jgi:hypothetical protein
MALHLLGSKLPQALPRHLVKGLRPLAKATVPLVGDSTVSAWVQVQRRS